MGFADPQTINAIASGPTSLSRVSMGINTVTFGSSDGTVKLSVASTYGKRVRRTARLEHRKVAADPYLTSTNTPFSGTAYLVTDFPVVGYTVAQQLEVAACLNAWLSASTNAQLTKILGGEI